MTQRFRLARVLTVSIALAISCGVASAQSWTATLNGANESPVNTSLATGTASFVLSGSMFTITTSFTGLTSGVTSAHIHCCTAVPFTGVAGVATVPPAFPSFPLGVQAGTYSMSFDISQASFWNPSFLTANGGSTATAQATLVSGLNSGTTYFNIHTSQFPGGEIRGFIVSTVPEPSKVALTAAGLLALVAIGRRRVGMRSA